MKRIEIERSVPTQIAIKKAEKCFEYLNLKYDIHKKCSVNKLLATYSVILDGINIQGNGKGSGRQSLASALFEALEHYVYYNSFLCDENRKIEDINLQSDRLKREFPITYLLKKCNDQELLEVTKFKNLKKDTYIYYPTSLWNIFNKSFIGKYDELKKYSTNSGCAIGITKAEAILHAVNELLERDALSWHYYKVFINKSKNAKRVNICSLPLDLQRIYYEVKNSIKKDITVIKIETIQGFYCYMVYAENNNTGIPYKGSGLSTSPEYALERALLECLQTFHLSCKETEFEDKAAYENLRQYEKYLKILKLDYENHFTDVKFDSNVIGFRNVNEILNYESKILNQYEMEIYYKELLVVNDIYCVQVIIPGIEKFYLVGNGIPVILGNERENLERIYI
ncbi:MAG: YcaO-like family protein [Lachnospiraceae bacterium]